jgi:phosphoribosyl 1,2-cyclic phosphate phosphodiesterase
MQSKTPPITYTITLLGCGGSTGVPLAGCHCNLCHSIDPRNKRLRAAAHIASSDGLSVLIDAGPDLRQQALRAGIDHVDAVLFTHAHADHILGIDDLRAFNFSSRRAISCYASTETRAGICSVFNYVFNPHPLYEGKTAQLDLRTITEGEPVTISGSNEQESPLPLSFLPLTVYHGRLPVTMYRFGPIAYATDCNYIPPETIEQLSGVKVLFLDGLRVAPHPTHFSISEACELAQKLQVPRTILIHTDHSVDYNDTMIRLPQGVELGFDGLQVSWG